MITPKLQGGDFSIAANRAPSNVAHQQQVTRLGSTVPCLMPHAFALRKLTN